MSVYIKLLKAKKNIGAITKDSKNPFFKNNYFDINKLISEVEPILLEEGLLLLQPIKDGYVVTEIHDPETKENITSSMMLPEISDPQKLGSAITYFRRYTLQSLLGLQAEDDDGNSASKSVNNKITKPLATEKDIENITKAMRNDGADKQKILGQAKNHPKYRLSETQVSELELVLSL